MRTNNNKRKKHFGTKAVSDWEGTQVSVSFRILKSWYWKEGRRQSLTLKDFSTNIGVMATCAIKEMAAIIIYSSSNFQCNHLQKKVLYRCSNEGTHNTTTRWHLKMIYFQATSTECCREGWIGMLIQHTCRKHELASA